MFSFQSLSQIKFILTKQIVSWELLCKTFSIKLGILNKPTKIYEEKANKEKQKIYIQCGIQALHFIYWLFSLYLNSLHSFKITKINNLFFLYQHKMFSKCIGTHFAWCAGFSTGKLCLSSNVIILKFCYRPQTTLLQTRFSAK